MATTADDDRKERKKLERRRQEDKEAKRALCDWPKCLLEVRELWDKVQDCEGKERDRHADRLQLESITLWEKLDLVWRWLKRCDQTVKLEYKAQYELMWATIVLQRKKFALWREAFGAAEDNDVAARTGGCCAVGRSAEYWKVVCDVRLCMWKEERCGGVSAAGGGERRGLAGEESAQLAPETRRLVTLEELPQEVMAKVLAHVCCSDKRRVRLVSKEMRRMVDWARSRLSLPLEPWVTLAVLRGVASRFSNLEHMSMAAVPVGTSPLLQVPELLPLLTDVELVCGKETLGERDAVAEALAGATRLTRVTLRRMTLREELGLLRHCTGVRSLEVTWTGAGALDPDPLALSHMPGLKRLSCSGVTGPRALALLRGATSLTRLRIAVQRGVSLRPLGHLPGLRHLRVLLRKASLPRDFFSHCLAPACLGRLEHLDLRVRGASLQAAQGLAACSNLTFLQIHRRMLVDVEDLAEILGRLPRLRFCWVVSSWEVVCKRGGEFRFWQRGDNGMSPSSLR